MLGEEFRDNLERWETREANACIMLRKSKLDKDIRGGYFRGDRAPASLKLGVRRQAGRVTRISGALTSRPH